ncbi:MAG TPA: nuclear transport factor 2 family protein [Streptosporangiaceae bacterium]|nr:nuclear transport factor 2 family protein [Streptosporangiaceae bacterium]
MSTRASIGIVMGAFDAVERRDAQRLAQLYHPEVEFHWPPCLPYGGTFRGIAALQDRPTAATWDHVWDPLQPTERERQMNPRVVAATDQEVVVLWHQRGRQPAGQRLDMEALGLYGVRDGKFARAQMFYFDTAAVLGFLRADDEA